VEKCRRKYSPANCALSSNCLFKQMVADYQPEARLDLPPLQRTPRTLKQLKPGKLQFAERRYQTPDFPGRGEQDREMIKVKDRDFTLKSLKVGRSITPDSLTPTTQYTSRPLFSTTPRKSTNPISISVPTTTSDPNTSRDDPKSTDQSLNTQLSSEVASPILEPRYHLEPLTVTIDRTPPRSPRLRDLMTLFRDYEGTHLPKKELPSNKGFFLRPYQEARNFLEFLPEVPGERLKMNTVTRYLHARKFVSKGDFVDKETVNRCIARKADISIFISKRFGKPKIWHHTGRALSSRFENELRSYWPLV